MKKQKKDTLFLLQKNWEKKVGGEKSGKNKSSCYGAQSNNIIKENDGFRHARSVIKISNPRIRKTETSGHPTTKT